MAAMANLLLNVFSRPRWCETFCQAFSRILCRSSLFMGSCIEQSEKCTLRTCLQMNGGGERCSLAQRAGWMRLPRRGGAALGIDGPAVSRQPQGWGGRTGSTQVARGSDDPAVGFLIETLLKILPLMCCPCAFPRVILPEKPEKGNCSVWNRC